jgi:hypothetical protein
MNLIKEIKQILSESISLYNAFILISVDKNMDRMDIFNALRAVPNIVIVKPKDSDELNSRETEDIGYSYVNLKFIAIGDPMHVLHKIKHMALNGSKNMGKVEGLKSFTIQPNKIRKIDK